MSDHQRLREAIRFIRAPRALHKPVNLYMDAIATLAEHLAAAAEAALPKEEDMPKIEQVARALAKKRCARDQAKAVQGGCDIMLAPDVYMPLAREDARAAVEAMRDLSPEMYEGLSATGKMWREMNSREVWNTMIDAILAEKPE